MEPGCEASEGGQGPVPGSGQSPAARVRPGPAGPGGASAHSVYLGPQSGGHHPGQQPHGHHQAPDVRGHGHYRPTVTIISYT